MDKLNIKYSFNYNLREVPDDSEDMLKYIEAKEKELELIKEPNRYRFLEPT